MMKIREQDTELPLTLYLEDIRKKSKIRYSFVISCYNFRQEKCLI